MKVFYFGVILLVGCSVSFPSSGQDADMEYNREFIWGINKNSVGGIIGGIVAKKSYRRSERVFTTYGVEIMNVKSDLESRKSTQQGSSYLFGKSNYLFALRLQYGRDIVLFNKASRQGAEVKAVFAIGPTIGIVAPYYIAWRDSNGGDVVREQYDYTNANHTIDKIVDRGGTFSGIGESNIQLGINAKVALNFEIGVTRKSVTGFEIGFLADAYAKPVLLVPSGKNQSIFPTVFLTVFYGRKK